MTTHPFFKYAIALLMVHNDLQKEEEIDEDHILYELENGLNHYALEAHKETGRNKIKYSFAKKDADFSSPSFINKKAKDTIEKLIRNELTKDKLPLVGNPFAGEFSIFSSQGKGLNERGKPNWTLRDYRLGCITLSTLDKPCYRDKKNWCLIPDLELPDMILFIKLFEEMYINETKNLLNGKVTWKKSGKYTLHRPRLLNGNFPSAPQTSSMGTIALLGAIGKFAKDAKDKLSPEVCNVVKQLKDANIYLISSDEIKAFSFNHVIIDLASKGKLQSIVDSIYRIELFKVGSRSKIDKFNDIRKNEYDRFDLFVSRFLTLFNKVSFRGFFSFRAEYPNEMELLLKTYFCIMEKINEDIVNSAIAFGGWLNRQAFTYASKEIPVNPNLKEDEKKEKQTELKNKILIQFESAIMSAKSGDALVAFITTRAARLTGYDIDEGAKLFMSKVSCGELPLEQAKNLLIAFSRLKTVNKKNENV